MSKKGITVKDVPADKFISAYATHLKRTNWLKLPEWVDIVKTGTHKSLPPQNEDWYYIRAAAVARKIYLRGGTGIADLQEMYGGSKRRGPRPSHSVRGSGSIARHVVKQLQAIGVVELDQKRGGRKISQEGQRDLDRIAGRVHAQLYKSRAARAKEIVPAH
jgi:small subunit ribosomal protein S19e